LVLFVGFGRELIVQAKPFYVFYGYVALATTAY